MAKRLFITFTMVIVIVWTWFGWRYLQMMEWDYYVVKGNLVSVNRQDHKRVALYYPGTGKWVNFSREGLATVNE